MEWIINAHAYVGPDQILEEEYVYFLKGRLLALNQKGTQIFYYEPDTQILVNSSDSLSAGLANKVSVTGFGIIISRDVENVGPSKDNIIVIVRHSDYNPAVSIVALLFNHSTLTSSSIQTRTQDCFEVQYRANWSKLMEKLQPLLTLNREVQLTGYITGFIESRYMWTVNVCPFIYHLLIVLVINLVFILTADWSEPGHWL